MDLKWTCLPLQLLTDMFATSIADNPIPNFGSPGDPPYLGGFDLSAIDEALREPSPSVQDMSTLVLNNAQFRGEVADERDRQWYIAWYELSLE